MPRYPGQIWDIHSCQWDTQQFIQPLQEALKPHTYVYRAITVQYTMIIEYRPQSISTRQIRFIRRYWTNTFHIHVLSEYSSYIWAKRIQYDRTNWIQVTIHTERIDLVRSQQQIQFLGLSAKLIQTITLHTTQIQTNTLSIKKIHFNTLYTKQTQL